MFRRLGMLLVACAATFVMISCEAEIYSELPPPDDQVEVVGVAPGPGYIWLNGYWGWEGGRYAWHAGRWETPPEPHAVYEHERWEKRGTRYYFHRGGWRRP